MNSIVTLLPSCMFCCFRTLLLRAINCVPSPMGSREVFHSLVFIFATIGIRPRYLVAFIFLEVVLGIGM